VVSDDILIDSRRRTILVVGAGYGGLRFFRESLELTLSHGLADSIRYVFVDERPLSSYGRGVAWASDQNPHMRANMHSPEIEVDPKTRESVANVLGISYDHQPTAGELFAKSRSNNLLSRESRL